MEGEITPSAEKVKLYMDPFPLKKQTQGHQKEIYINNDGWKEKPQKSHYLIFHKLYMTARVWLFNIVLEFIPCYH